MNFKEKLKAWVLDTGIRTLKTIAQAGIAYIGSAIALNQVDWLQFGSVCILAGILCVLTNLATFPERGGKDE